MTRERISMTQRGYDKLRETLEFLKTTRREQITILTPVSDDDVIYDTAAGVRVIPVKRHWFSRFFPEFSPALYQYLREHGNEYDLIHVHGLWHFGSIAPYLLDLRPPKVMTIHGLLDQWAIRHGY